MDARDEIRFARFTEGWLQPRRGPDPTITPPPRRPPGGALAAGAGEAAGLCGGVRVSRRAPPPAPRPYSDRFPLGTRDFPASLWFRSTATTGEQPLLWMGGIGTNQPQVWLRGEPASDRIQGLITVRDGAAAPRSVSVRTTGAYNDGRWHHLALRRGGGRLTLFVDGEKSDSADVPGSVSRNSPFGVHIGQRMDGRAFFTGAIDDVHVWDRALGDAESADGRGLSTSDAGNLEGTVLWLPMDRVRTSH